MAAPAVEGKSPPLESDRSGLGWDPSMVRTMAL